MNINIVVIQNQVAIMEALLSLRTSVSNEALEKLKERINISNGIIRDSA